MRQGVALLMREADGDREATQLVIPGFGCTMQDHFGGARGFLENFEIGPANPLWSNARAEGLGDGFFAGKSRGQGGHPVLVRTAQPAPAVCQLVRGKQPAQKGIALAFNRLGDSTDLDKVGATSNLQTALPPSTPAQHQTNIWTEKPVDGKAA